MYYNTVCFVYYYLKRKFNDMKRILASALFMFLFTGFVSAQIYIYNSGKITDSTRTLKKDDKSYTVQKNNKLSSVKNNKFDMSKLVFGGDLGFQFSDYTAINISPQVGYAFSKYMTAGVGVGYSYFKDKYYEGIYRYNEKSSYASFNLYADFYPVKFIVLSAQPQISRMWHSIDHPNGKYKESDFIPSFLIGGGIHFNGANFRLMYDVVQNKNSPYGNSIFYNVGYSFSINF